MASKACSFCGKSEREVERLLAGTAPVYICNECLDLCNDILAEESSGSKPARSPVDDVPPWEPTEDELAELQRIGKELGAEAWAVPVIDGKLDVSQASPVTRVDSGRGKKRESNLRCSFCGKSDAKVRKLIAGPAVYVCDECIDRFNSTLAEERSEE